MNYTMPGSYVERVKNVRTYSDLPSTSVAGFVGETVRGIPNKAIKVTSWTQFEQNFAKGITNPFTVGHVADAVYGFFANGGKELYVVRALEEGSVKASATVPSTGGVKFLAKDEGVWGNDLAIEIAEVGSYFTLTVSLKGSKVEELKKLTTENFEEVINSESSFLMIDPTNTGTIAVGTGTFANGTEVASTSATFTNGLKCFDALEDINLIAIPNMTIEGVQEGLVDYCGLRNNVFAVVDAPQNATIEEVKNYKDGMSSFLGAIYYPHIQIIDPVTGVKKVVAPSGHVCGMIARTDATRGVHKAPAGLDASLYGAISVDKYLSETEIGDLNDYEVNCIMPKKGSGIVVWGARMLKVDADRQFVSDIRLDMFVEEAVKRNTEWAVFEPKDEQLFNSIEGMLNGLMTNLWREGKFYGTTPEDAFFVKCDAELNPDILSSELNIEVGYAKKKPAEFVITRISHKQN